ncbi:MAG: hypothetical protein HY261_02155 [Chloroflexi bacterium]|nr:hypothetical protein [Chloroflexota bacterium]
MTDYPRRRVDLVDEIAWGLHVASAGTVPLFAALQTARALPLSNLVLWSEYGQDMEALRLTSLLHDGPNEAVTRANVARYSELVEAMRGPALEAQQWWYEAAGMPKAIAKHGVSDGLIWLTDGNVIVGEAMGEAIDVASRHFSLNGQQSAKATAERRRLMLEVIVPGATMSVQQALITFGDRPLPSWMEVLAVVGEDGKVAGLAIKNKGLAAFYATLIAPTVEALAQAVRTLSTSAEVGAKLSGPVEPTGPWKEGHLVRANAKAPERTIWDGDSLARAETIRFNASGALKAGGYHAVKGLLMTSIADLMSKADLDIGGPFTVDRGLLEEARSNDEWQTWWKLADLVGDDAISSYVCLNENLYLWDSEAADDARVVHWGKAFAQAAMAAGGACASAVAKLTREWESFQAERASDQGQWRKTTGLPNEGRWRQCGLAVDEEALFWREVLVTSLPGWHRVQLHQRGLASQIAKWLDARVMDAAVGYELAGGAMARLGASMAKADALFDQIQPASQSYVDHMSYRPIDPKHLALGVW